MLTVSDNTGAKTVKCIRTGPNNKKYAKVGQIITVSVRSVVGASKIAKGTVCKAVIVRTKSPIVRKSNEVIRFSDNAVVILNEKLQPIGTRILGTVATELRKNFSTVISLAKDVI